MLNPDYNFATILLAAGLATRMKGEHKLTKIWRGAPLIHHSLKTIKTLNTSQNILVTSALTRKLKTSIDLTGFTIVENPNPEIGMSQSIALGCKALRDDIDAVFISLADMPDIPASIYQQLSQAFDPPRMKDICLPVFENHQGHPVLFSKLFIRDLMALEGDRGAKSIVKNNRSRLVTLPTNESGVTRDFDISEDFRET